MRFPAWKNSPACCCGAQNQFRDFRCCGTCHITGYVDRTQRVLKDFRVKRNVREESFQFGNISISEKIPRKNNFLNSIFGFLQGNRDGSEVKAPALRLFSVSESPEQPCVGFIFFRCKPFDCHAVFRCKFVRYGSVPDKIILQIMLEVLCGHPVICRRKQ